MTDARTSTPARLGKNAKKKRIRLVLSFFFAFLPNRAGSQLPTTVIASPLSRSQHHLFRSRGQGGQLAIGLAFAFLTILSMFALVFQSSLLTREKMKLQQTTDMAALAGAEVQRSNLNFIVETNKNLDRYYNTTQSLLTPLPCWALHGMTAANTATQRIVMQAAAQAINPTKTVGQTCTEICQAFDEASRNVFLVAYDTAVKQSQTAILNSVAKANKNALDLSYKVIFSRTNLPLRIRQYAENRFGGGFTAEQLKKAYIEGKLEDKFTVVDAIGEMPLFAPQADIRTFQYPTSISQDVKSVYPPMDYCTYPQPLGRPIIKVVSGKIGRAGGLNTAFFTGTIVNFSDLKSFVEDKYKIFLKNPNSKEHEKLSYGSGVGGDGGLFQSRMMMTALSMAKPYGGKFPEAASLTSNPLGFAGDEFDGAKLIGFADDEAQGVNIFRGETIGFGDPNSAEKIEIDIGAEILH